MRRRRLAAVAVLVLLVSGGCLSTALGDTLEMSSEPAAVEAETATAAEYDLVEYRELSVNDTVAVGSTHRQVNATSHLVVYNRSMDLRAYDGETAMFAVVSTPDVTALGQSMNPVARMSHRELLGEFEDDIEAHVGEIGEPSYDRSRTEPVLGAAANVSTFETETVVDGERVTLELHVARVHHDGDLLVAIGGHPEALQQQSATTFRLVRAIEHPVDPATLTSDVDG